jgi:hypothetical protein
MAAAWALATPGAAAQQTAYTTGKEVAAVLSANGAQYPSLGRMGSPASLLAGAVSPRYLIPKPPRAEGPLYPSLGQRPRVHAAHKTAG